MDMQQIISGPLVPETMTHAIEVAGFNLDWLLSAGLGIAILMFFVKEGWEWVKKRQDNNRKMQVYKRVIAQECAYLRTYSSHLHMISENVRPVAAGYEVITEPSGRKRLIILNEMGRRQSSIALPSVGTSNVERLIIETGYIDPKFSESVSILVDVIFEMSALRDKIIDSASPSFAASKAIEMEFLWTKTKNQTSYWMNQLNIIIDKCEYKGKPKK